jgi:hypothetical protein
MFLFIFMGGLIELSQNKDDITLFYRIYFISIGFFLSFNCHFLFEYTKIRINKFIKYLPSLLSESIP